MTNTLHEGATLVDKDQPNDRGFSLIELLLVIVVVGVLAATAIFAVAGVSEEATENACATGARTLAVAVEAYELEHGDAPIPATPPLDGEEFERTLVSAGLIRSTSEFWNVTPEGYLVNIQPC